MKELELGKRYALKDSNQEHTQTVVFSTSEDSTGTSTSEVLNVLIEKLYADQFRQFSCERATAIEFLKAARRILTKNSLKNRSNE